MIADDHPVVREGLRRLLEAEPDHKVIGEASDGAEAVKLVRQLKPDILLLDLVMPKHPGMEALRELITPPNATPVRVIPAGGRNREEPDCRSASTGSQGVVLKDSLIQVLLKAIQTVMACEHWVNREPVSNRVVYLRTLVQSTHDEARQRKFGLTPRELEIISAVRAGYSNHEIAEYFGISEDEVKRHLSNIFDKLGVASGLEIFIERSRLWRAVRRMTEAIDPLHGIYTVFAISVLVFVLFVLTTVKYGYWR